MQYAATAYLLRVNQRITSHEVGPAFSDELDAGNLRLVRLSMHTENLRIRWEPKGEGWAPGDGRSGMVTGVLHHGWTVTSPVDYTETSGVYPVDVYMIRANGPDRHLRQVVRAVGTALDRLVPGGMVGPGVEAEKLYPESYAALAGLFLFGISSFRRWSREIHLTED